MDDSKDLLILLGDIAGNLGRCFSAGETTGRLFKFVPLDGDLIEADGDLLDLDSELARLCFPLSLDRDDIRDWLILLGDIDGNLGRCLSAGVTTGRSFKFVPFDGDGDGDLPDIVSDSDS